MNEPTPLRFLPGIGPARATALAAAGYNDAWDVVFRAPRLLGPPPPWCDDGPLPRGETLRIRARVAAVRAGFIPGRGRLLTVQIVRRDGRPITARFFRAGFIARRMLVGEWFVFTGRSDATKADTLNHPAFEHLKQGEHTPAPETSGVRVAWTIPEGFGEQTWTRLIARCLDDPSIADPAELIEPAAWRAVLYDLHRPPDALRWEKARRQLAQRECLALAWSFAMRRDAVTVGRGTAWRWDDDIHQRALARLPYTLTAGQAAALAEIRADMQSGTPMYRLLAGDVGSGKTALTLVAALAVIADGAQAAIMAPTAVLANQHYAVMSACLAGSRVRCGLLTASATVAERARLLAGLGDGSIQLIIGTHAMLDDNVRFARLGLAVIDEQHRFGVAQRAALSAKAPPSTRADLLLTTATPIPSTLALTAYGDLAVTRINGRPPGRSATTTEVRMFTDWKDLGRLVAAEPGRSFVVCPRIASDDDQSELPVTQVADALRTALGAAVVGVLTGDMSEVEKNAALRAFSDGEIRCLVATTIIEVGVDVPEAILAVVLDANRFGMASLHQLRGRVGRGTRPGRCVLMHRSAGTDAERRLTQFAQTTDGMAIAEADLAERGAGALLGLRQHGHLQLRATDLVRDVDLLQEAHATVHAVRLRGSTMPAGLVRLVAHAPGQTPD